MSFRITVVVTQMLSDLFLMAQKEPVEQSFWANHHHRGRKKMEGVLEVGPDGSASLLSSMARARF
jgi:hypothetical protein